MTWIVRPDPATEAERVALIEAAERVLVDEGVRSPLASSRWWRSSLEDLGGGPAAEEAGGDAGVVET